MTEIELAAQTGLRVFFRRVDAAGQEGEDVDLPPELIEGGLLEMFQRFPNGRYRVYLQEANSERERMIQEVNVYQGRVVPPDFRESGSERQLENEEQLPQDEPRGDADWMDIGGDRAEGGHNSSTPAEPAQAQEPESDERSAASDAAAGAWNGAAGAIGGAGLAKWNRRGAQAFVPGRRSLSTGARLMRRLRMQSGGR